jgi:hypothetical protein
MCILGPVKVRTRKPTVICAPEGVAAKHMLAVMIESGVFAIVLRFMVVMVGSHDSSTSVQSRANI